METIKTLNYYDVLELFKLAAKEGWTEVSLPDHVLQMKSPEGKYYTVTGALYKLLTDQEPPKGSNIFMILTNLGLNKNVFNKLQYLAEHDNYVERPRFDEALSKAAARA